MGALSAMAVSMQSAVPHSTFGSEPGSQPAAWKQGTVNLHHDSRRTALALTAPMQRRTRGAGTRLPTRRATKRERERERERAGK
mmetsp:Transcript_65668/g.170575  ORF Transcript_65668/g.170575 Transcript_65668/m.170575 type:complete len:84 (-) Transcript_65668:155-406(-)